MDYKLSKDGKTLLWVDKHISGHFDVPEGVEVISRLIFCDCESLESIHLPNSIKIIGDKAFWNCKSLKYIIVENPKIYKSYKEHKNGFKGCDAKVLPRFSIKDLVNEIDWF